jgi:hypothetical protein
MAAQGAAMLLKAVPDHLPERDYQMFAFGISDALSAVADDVDQYCLAGS